MEAKKFEEFYSLCERTVSRQRLLGAGNKDIAFVLTGMMATLPEDELTLPQHKKLVDLVVNREESQEETAKIMSEEEFRLHLKKTRDTIVEQCGRECGRDLKRMFLIGWVTAPIKQVYTSGQLKRIFALADK